MVPFLRVVFHISTSEVFSVALGASLFFLSYLRQDIDQFVFFVGEVWLPASDCFLWMFLWSVYLERYHACGMFSLTISHISEISPYL